MKKTNLICYFNDSKIYFYDQKNRELISEKIINVVFEGKITNPDKFYKQVSSIIKKERIINNIFNNSILIIIPSNYNKTDDYIISNIFEKLEFNTIKLKKEKDLLNIRPNYSLIKIEENYLIYYYLKNKKIKYITISFSTFIDSIEISISDILNKYNNHFKINTSYIFGTNNLINKIINKSNKLKYYMYENPSTYILDKYILSYE